jgi:hemolysin III
MSLPLEVPRLRGVSHLWACAVALVAGAILVALAPAGAGKLAALMYAASLCGMLGASAAYHRLQSARPSVRSLLRRLDHSMIFVLVAGTTTPFALLLLDGSAQVIVLATVWTGALAGIVFAFAWPSAPNWLRATLYVALGWGAAASAPGVLASAGAGPVILLALGGLLYTAGAVVYVRQRPDPSPAVFGYHEVFHVFVLAAAVVHFAAVAGYALPAG